MDGRRYLRKEMMKIYHRLNITNKLKLLSYAKLALHCKEEEKNKAASQKSSFYQ
ncbi:MAG: hypothetical protein VB081_04015 [Christensenella sp.]|uniref:hypothetical protein n=1 Tax=Christensenella sp. TaxID=1935934 RepID=UPI002B22163E|nr:hypothetical protein [Christensenella sp.]MEA5002644.1 hypothetical protein [Christensenella sp.]